jgi:hypothetical protein
MNIISPKLAAVGAAIFASVLAVATANASVTHQELVALTGGAPSATVTLPQVTISPAAPYGSLYDTGHSVKASSEHFIPASRYQVPTGDDTMAAMHPYTTGLGPCTMNASPAQGCHHDTSNPIPPSHYERAPFSQ